MAVVQQARAVATRAQIVLHAAEAFEKAGFAGASLGTILASAGTTKGALYFHFRSKEALARFIIAEQHRISIADFDTVLGDLPEHPGDDDWAASAEILFGGHEVRALSGSDPVRGGPDLDPADWFLPFEPGKTRNPDRGFRL